MATIAATMQTRITASGVELTSEKAEIGYGYFERHPLVRALCPPWILALND